jgi:Lysophospholipase catalytic domain
MSDAKESPSSKESMNNPAVNLALILRDEFEEVTRLCENRGATPDLFVGKNDGPAHRLGVAFSGGGIRSASVNLGMIQGLAKAGILKQVHYMSGISGGGYILGWLTTWIRRSGFAAVQQQLAPPEKPDETPASQPSPGYARFLEPNPIRHLREYASYLTPRVGLGSGDTLAMVSIYLRNVLLNQALIISALACIVALLQMLAPWTAWRGPAPLSIQIILLLVGIGAGVVSGILTGRALNCLGTDQEPKYEPRKAGIFSALADHV